MILRRIYNTQWQLDIYDDIYLIENDKVYEIIEHNYNYGTRSKNISWEQD
jgi:hypothetical protein